MATNIFVNLPVRDLDKSVEFFKRVGYSFNAQFTDATAACMVVSDTIYAMLLTHEKFQGFINTEICDAKKSTEVLLCLTEDSRAGVDERVGRALEAGGTEPRSPQDHGFMYGRAYQDLDGHVWEVVWMDPSAVQPQ
ncbi:VOC family protein [Pseudoduganella sp. LjRoot289]|uniref:VOC family protein n=1 Tax=Pseudoduganella sp. LjRoot289 TaxID=3342314 RepID=UPI003ECDEDFF